MRFIKNIFNKKNQTFPIQYISDQSGHTLPYVFKPAPKPEKPLLLILHGNGNNKNPGGYISPEYNIILPLDQYGIRKNGCWFMGEKGDFFIYALLARLIEKYRLQNGIKNELYIWGSSMGGYAGLIYGAELSAHAVFSHIPQTNLYDSHWYQKNRPFIDLIFGDDKGRHPYRNIPLFIQGYSSRLPLIFLSFNRFDRPYYNDEHLQPLQKALEARDANYFLIIHPQRGHNLYQKIAEHVAYFDFYRKEIEENFSGELVEKGRF